MKVRQVSCKMPDITSVRHFNEYCGMIKRVRIDFLLTLNRGWSPQNPVFSRFGSPDRAKTVYKSIILLLKLKF